MDHDVDVIPELQPYPAVLTAAQVAEIMQMQVTTVQRHLASGVLPGTKVGRDWRVRRIALQEVILGTWTPAEAQET